MAARTISLGWEIPAYFTDCELWQSEDITLEFTRSAATTISGWSISAYLRKFTADADPVLTLSGTITSASSGIFTLPLTSAQTEALVNQGYQLEVWRTDSGSLTLMAVVTISVLKGTRS
jgi:hypothetical protein